MIKNQTTKAYYKFHFILPAFLKKIWTFRWVIVTINQSSEAKKNLNVVFEIKYNQGKHDNHFEGIVHVLIVIFSHKNVKD